MGDKEVMRGCAVFVCDGTDYFPDWSLFAQVTRSPSRNWVPAGLGMRRRGWVKDFSSRSSRLRGECRAWLSPPRREDAKKTRKTFRGCRRAALCY